mgnify:CR=1 FL=1
MNSTSQRTMARPPRGRVRRVIMLASAIFFSSLIGAYASSEWKLGQRIRVPSEAPFLRTSPADAEHGAQLAHLSLCITCHGVELEGTLHALARLQRVVGPSASLDRSVSAEGQFALRTRLSNRNQPAAPEPFLAIANHRIVPLTGARNGNPDLRSNPICKRARRGAK